MGSTLRFKAATLAAVTGISILAGAALTLTFADDDAAAPSASATAEGGSVPISSVTASGFPALVERVSNSVVAIRTVVGTGFRQGSGTGTGIVVDKDGHIVTNYHVIEGAREVSVEFVDGTVVAGTVVRTDEANDLAVVRVSAAAGLLAPATFADSSLVHPGETVFAIGNPFGLDFTVTSGIVSAVNRTSPAEGVGGEQLRGMIQTDAAVNPGNSGGPLFNAAGEVIGINTAIENPSGNSVFVGVGFAIASNTVREFLAGLNGG